MFDIFYCFFLVLFVIGASDIITFEVPQCIENHRGMDIRNGFYTDEYVYLVIKGFDNRQRTNYTQNRFVVTAKSVPFPQYVFFFLFQLLRFFPSFMTFRSFYF